jgi:exopolyphosphatase/guanosine-5'-triphosphate,3'-diphosphate pyrophosphatase
VLAGGLAVMQAALRELHVERINPVGGALRLGVLYDLLGRTSRRDSRVVTVERFAERYRIDREHAQRVAVMAKSLYQGAVRGGDATSAQHVEWAGLLHEIGFSVSHIGFHKHGAYILENADMPGFSAGEQHRLALLVLGCRGSLDKVGVALADVDTRAQILALRLAVLFHHARRAIDPPVIGLSVDRAIKCKLPVRWLAARPQTAHLLDKELAAWSDAGYAIQRKR